MEKLSAVLQIILPIFTCIFLGIFAKRRNIMTSQQVSGLQQFAIKFCMPCVLFNAYLTASFTPESLSSMALVLLMVLVGTLWACRFGRKRFPYRVLPMVFAAYESGMLGIPLFITLFGAANAYYMGILDLAQAVVAISVITILSAPESSTPTPGTIVRQVVSSPLLILGVLGLVLNLSGAYSLLDRVGIGPILTETTTFIAAPTSAVMLFTVGYNLSVRADFRGKILRLFLVRYGYSIGAMVLIQGILFLIPDVNPMTRWAMLIYCTLPSSYIGPSLARNEEDGAISSGVCSIGTVVALVVFCVITVIVA